MVSVECPCCQQQFINNDEMQNHVGQCTIEFGKREARRYAEPNAVADVDMPDVETGSPVSSDIDDEMESTKWYLLYSI